MKIHQSVLYVGLGGVGLQIGTQLEQQLRTEMCGPDGLALTKHPQLAELSPFELPPFLQFLYADLDGNARNTAQTAGRLDTDTAASTATYLNVAPAASSSVTVTETLRQQAGPAVRGWLPGPQSEPAVSPLTSGAGQLPTVGRAALFGRFLESGGVEPVRAGLLEAFRRIATSRDQLQALLGYQPRRGCDIFVGFSVAGGTGAGLFLDFLRLTAAAAQEILSIEGDDQADVKIYPVVVLPSALDFDTADRCAQIRRAADLNGGPALMDLFEMVDRCNSGLSNREVIYPGEQPGPVGEFAPAPTAFLFGKQPTAQPDDLPRSVVAFILSLIGTKLQTESGTSPWSFASEFLSSTQRRGELAPDGTGLRPASTAVAAQLTVPITEIAEILASRLVAQATMELRQAAPDEDNQEPIQSFIVRSGLTPLQERAVDHQLPAVRNRAKGASSVFGMLSEHRAMAAQQNQQLYESLETKATALAAKFRWGPAVREAVAQHDLFRVRRVVLGVPGSHDETTRAGFAGFVHQRGRPLQPPAPQFATGQPAPPTLSDRFLGLRRVRFTDPAPRTYLQEISDWYVWRAQAEWHTAWGNNSPIWVPQLWNLKSKLDNTIKNFEAQAENEPERFRDSCAQLYAPRIGAVYLLPDPGLDNDLDLFYRTVLLPALRQLSGLPEQAGAGQIVGEIMAGRWDTAYEQAQTAGDSQALQYVLNLAHNHVYAAVSNEMPRLKELLHTAATGKSGKQQPAELAGRLETALTKLLPDGTQPGGRGGSDLDIRVFYPADAPDPKTEDYLKERLPHSESTQSYHPVADGNFISVIMTRTELPATGVGDFRQLMRTWGDAVDNPQDEDVLAWRQRLDREPRWGALPAESCRNATLSLLNAIWDGSVEILAGTEEDPEKIRILQFNAPLAAPIELSFEKYGALSGWSGFLRAYEQFALSDSDTATARCAQLLSRRAPHSTVNKPRQPSPLYEKFVAMVPEQAALARELYMNAAETGRCQAEQTLQFWNDMVPQTLALELEQDGKPAGYNHLELHTKARKARVLV